MGCLSDVSDRKAALRQGDRSIHLRHTNHIRHSDLIVLRTLADTYGDAGTCGRCRPRLRRLGDNHALLRLRVIALHYIYHKSFLLQKRCAFRLRFSCRIGNLCTLRSLRHCEHNRCPFIYHQPILYAGAKHRACIVRAVFLVFNFRRKLQIQEHTFRFVHMHTDHADHLYLFCLLFLLLWRFFPTESKNAHRPANQED